MQIVYSGTPLQELFLLPYPTRRLVFRQARQAMKKSRYPNTGSLLGLFRATKSVRFFWGSRILVA
jgi:hypothetical protein